MNVPDLGAWMRVPEEVIEAAKSGELVMFVGAGVSMQADLPSWKKFAHLVLDDLTAEGLFNHSQAKLLRSLEPRKILSIARHPEHKTKTNLDYAQYFTPEDSQSDVYKSLNSMNCTFVTTNYDLLLKPRVENPEPDRSSPQLGDRVATPNDMLRPLLDQPGHVIHLHGSIEQPESMVISTAEYLKRYQNESVQIFLEYLFSRKTVVFVGYGLEETELLEHILRRGLVQAGSKEKKLFALKGYYSHEKPIYEQLFKYYKHTFGLHLLGYSLDTKGYKLLDSILRDWSKEIKVQPVSLSHHANMLERLLDSPTHLSESEKREALRRIADRPELVPIFFQRVKGVEWYDELNEQKYFSVENNPRPRKSDDGEHILVPYWMVLDYLEKTSLELKEPKNLKYAEKFLDLTRSVTQFTRDKEFSNYRTWWKFTYILSNVPSKFVLLDDLPLIDYWLDDPLTLIWFVN